MVLGRKHLDGFLFSFHRSNDALRIVVFLFDCCGSFHDGGRTAFLIIFLLDDLEWIPRHVNHRELLVVSPFRPDIDPFGYHSGFLIQLEIVLTTLGETHSGTMDDLPRVVRKHLERESMSDIPRESDEPSADFIGLLATNLTMVFAVVISADAHPVPENETEQHRYVDGLVG